MQTSYLHISMVIQLPFKAAENKDRIGFLKLMCLSSPLFLGEGEKSTKNLSKLLTVGVNSSIAPSSKKVEMGR